MIHIKVLSEAISLRYFPRLIGTTISAWRSSGRASKPFKLQLENGNICNLSCTMCPIDDLTRKKGQITFENFKRIFDEVMPCYLNLTGIGEPFLHKDIFKIIEYAKSKRTFIKLDSNATLISRKNAEKIIDTKLDILSISIDGTDKKTYEAIRRRANFDVVMENLKNLTELNKQREDSNTEIHLFMVLQKDNFYQLPEFITLGNELCVNSINGTFVKDLGGIDNNEKSIVWYNEEETKKVLEEALVLIKKSKIKVRMNGLFDYLKKGKITNNRDAPCFMPWYSPFVTWDGYLNSCCLSSNNEIVFGNILEEPFMKVWNNPRAMAFRKQMLKKRVGLCASCGVEENFIYDKFKPTYKIPVVNSLSSRR